MESLKRIVHVDDDQDIRAVVKLTLELIGEFELVQFSSGKDAIDGAAGFGPQLFLLDVMMPELSGIETWKLLKSQPELKDIPAIFMTAKAERNNSEKLLSMGALAVIFKPFEPTELCGKILELWNNQETQAAS